MMKKLLSIAFLFFSLTTFSQDIKVKQVIGAVHPSRPNIQVNGQSSFIPSWTWNLRTVDAGLTYTDGKCLFNINDTLFAVGGYNGNLAEFETDSIHYSVDKGATWNAYWVKFPYAFANVASIKARYPGDWNYIFGSTQLLGGNTRTVTRFKDFTQFYTMTTTAEYGIRIDFGATQDQYGNIYIFGGQDEKDTGHSKKDVWMSTAQSGGASWTQVQSGLNWLGGEVYNSVQERNGWIYVINAGTTFGQADHIYSALVKKISVENIADSSKWVTVQSTPSNVDSCIFGASAVYKGNIIFGLGYARGNTNQLAYLDNDDQWHYLHNYIGYDSATVAEIISTAHASDMIVIGESLFTGFGAASTNFVQLKDSSIVGEHTVKRLSIRKDFFLSQTPSFYTGIIGNNLRGGIPHATNDYIRRLSTDPAQYIAMPKTGDFWLGFLNDGNSTANTDVLSTVGRRFHIQNDGTISFYTNEAQTNYVRISNDILDLNHNSEQTIRWKVGGTSAWGLSGSASNFRVYNYNLGAYSADLAATGQLTLNQYTPSNFNGGTSDDSVLVVTSAGLIRKRNASAFGGGGSGTTSNALTFDNSGSGDASGSTFNGSAAKTLSYNSIGAQPTLVSGTNIKTINGTSLLGSGDISISGGSPTLTQNQIGVGDGSNLLSGSSNLTWDGQFWRINHASEPVLRIGIGGTNYYQWDYTTNGFAFYSMQAPGGSKAVFNVGSLGVTTIDPDASVGNTTTSLEVKRGTALLPFLKVGSTGSTAYSITLQNSVDQSGFIEYASTDLNHYTAGTLRTVTNSNGFRINGSSKYLNFGSTDGSTGYGVRDNAGTIQFKNSGGAWKNVGGVQTISSQYTDASNVSTTETDLLSYTLPASTLVNNGDRVVIEGMFTTPSNGNSKSMKFYFGAASVDWGSSTIANGATIFIRATIYKNGSNTQRIQIERITGYSDFPVYSTATETDSGSIVIKFSGTGAASADITQRTMSVTYYPAP